jgi:hypothetical protein
MKKKIRKAVPAKTIPKENKKQEGPISQTLKNIPFATNKKEGEELTNKKV